MGAVGGRGGRAGVAAGGRGRAARPAAWCTASPRGSQSGGGGDGDDGGGDGSGSRQRRPSGSGRLHRRTAGTAGWGLGRRRGPPGQWSSLAEGPESRGRCGAEGWQPPGGRTWCSGCTDPDHTEDRFEEKLNIQ